jgi:hypothetical protein
MAKPHRCDVPGCTNDRRRWMRLCEQCFARLPGDIRTGLIDAFRQNRRSDWRRFCKRAGEHLAAQAAPKASPARLSAEQAFDLNQRLLGER